MKVSAKDPEIMEDFRWNILTLGNVTAAVTDAACSDPKCDLRPVSPKTNVQLPLFLSQKLAADFTNAREK